MVRAQTLALLFFVISERAVQIVGLYRRFVNLLQMEQAAVSGSALLTKRAASKGPRLSFRDTDREILRCMALSVVQC